MTQTYESTATAPESVDELLEGVQAVPKRHWWQYEVTKRRIPLKDLQQFSRELAVFLKAGIPILEALHLIRSETGNKLFGEVLDEMITSLHAGSTFVEAAERRADAFPPYYLGILQAAEMIGNLDSVLLQLADYLERDLDARRKVISALIYPAVIAVMGVGVIGVLVGYILPRFEKFFKSLDAKLPLQTRILLDVGHGFSTYWYLVVAFVGCLFGLALWLTQTARGRAVRDRGALRLPVLGNLVHLAVLERFCRTLSAMVAAGVPLPDALAVASKASSNVVYQRGIDDARSAMMRGEGLAEPLAQTGLFPPAVRQMLHVGESTGTLDQQLATTAEYLERELDYKLKKFTALFEPAVIVVMGGLVAFVAIALVSAMYGIFHQVHIAG
jgi:type IV pilus assembly protein PilC